MTRIKSFGIFVGLSAACTLVFGGAMSLCIKASNPEPYGYWPMSVVIGLLMGALAWSLITTPKLTTAKAPRPWWFGLAKWLLISAVATLVFAGITCWLNPEHRLPGGLGDVFVLYCVCAFFTAGGFALASMRRDRATQQQQATRLGAHAERLERLLRALIDASNGQVKGLDAEGKRFLVEVPAYALSIITQGKLWTANRHYLTGRVRTHGDALDVLANTVGVAFPSSYQTASVAVEVLLDTDFDEFGFNTLTTQIEGEVEVLKAATAVKKTA